MQNFTLRSRASEGEATGIKIKKHKKFTPFMSDAGIEPAIS
jgi:hypothetical protein